MKESLRSWIAYLRTERRRFLLFALVVPAFILVPNLVAAPGALGSLLGLYLEMAISGALGGALFLLAFLVRGVGYHEMASFKSGWIAFVPMAAMLAAQARLVKLRGPYYTGTLFFLWVVVGTVAGLLLLGR